jgi:hypothetical protein
VNEFGGEAVERDEILSKCETALHPGALFPEGGGLKLSPREIETEIGLVYSAMVSLGFEIKLLSATSLQCACGAPRSYSQFVPLGGQSGDDSETLASVERARRRAFRRR